MPHKAQMPHQGLDFGRRAEVGFRMCRAKEAVGVRPMKHAAPGFTLLEPIMTIVMAGMIVFMILAVLMPIFQLNQLMQ